MQTLREKLFQSSRFLIGTELVSVRGGMSERGAVRARDFANDLVQFPGVDWISITDNAGGNPQLAPTALGKPILYAGKEVVIHLTCKDLNRNGLESEAWLLNSEGFHNILAMTGDFPVAGNEGLVKAARSFAKQTFAHASGDRGIERVIDGGVDSVEHGFFARDDQLAKMRDRQIAWVPTLAPVQWQVDHADIMGWDDGVVSNLKRILDQHAASLVQAHALGVQIIAGSDAGSCGVAHGLGFLDELELMERAGLSPLTVINSATGVASNRLGFKEDFGRIRPGFLSRFILTRHSPLERVANLRRNKLVVFDGEVLESREHDQLTGL